MQISKRVVVSISTITCRIPGKPLKRGGAYAIVTALNQPHLVLAPSRRSIIAFWLVLGLARQTFAQDLCLVPTDPPSLDLRRRPAANAAQDGAADESVEINAQQRGRQRRRAMPQFSGEVEIKLPRRHAHGAERARGRTATSTCSAASNFVGPDVTVFGEDATTTKRRRRSASRAPASISRNGRRAARRTRSRSPATAACRSRTSLFTTCPPDNLAWEISARDIDARRQRRRRHGARRQARLQGRADSLRPLLHLPDQRRAQERFPDARHQQRDRTGFDSDRALLPEPRAELRPDARAALHEQARHSAAQRLPLSLPNSRGDFGFEYLPDDDETQTTRRYANLQHESLFGGRDQLEVLARHRRSLGRRLLRGLRQQPERHEPNAPEPLRRSHVLRAELVAADARSELSNDRSRAHGRRASVRARRRRWCSAAAGSDSLLVFDSNTELVNFDRNVGTTGWRFDSTQELSLRFARRRHVPDAGDRAAANELLARQSGAGRRRLC